MHVPTVYGYVCTVRSTISQTGKVASIATLFSRAKQIIFRNRNSIGLVIKATKLPQNVDCKLIAYRNETHHCQRR